MVNKIQLTNNFRDEKTWRLAINLCLALLLAHTLASLTWAISGPVDGTISQERMAVQQTRGLPASTSRVMVVTRETALFGKAGRVETSPVPLSRDTLSAPPTSLSLELKGVIAVEPMSRALAAIAEKGSKTLWGWRQSPGQRGHYRDSRRPSDPPPRRHPGNPDADQQENGPKRQ